MRGKDYTPPHLEPSIHAGMPSNTQSGHIYLDTTRSLSWKFDVSRDTPSSHGQSVFLFIFLFGRFDFSLCQSGITPLFLHTRVCPNYAWKKKQVERRRSPIVIFIVFVLCFIVPVFWLSFYLFLFIFFSSRCNFRCSAVLARISTRREVSERAYTARCTTESCEARMRTRRVRKGRRNIFEHRKAETRVGPEQGWRRNIYL